MPLFLIETIGTAHPDHDRTLRLSARRFPEVSLDHRYATRDDGGCDVWVCRAPSSAHLLRWSAALGIRLARLREVDPVELRTGPSMVSIHHLTNGERTSQ